MATDAEIRAGIEQLRQQAIAAGQTEAQLIKTITDEAFKRGITLNDIARATGAGGRAVADAIDRANAQGANIVVPRSARVEFTDDEIAEGIQQVLATPGLSQVEQITTLANEAVRRGIPLSRLADASDFSNEDVANAIELANSQGANIVIPGDLALPPPDASLPGAESAIDDALIQARQALTTSNQDAVNALNRGTDQATAELSEFAQTGRQANQRLAALNGLLGPEAQREAIDNFIDSPAQASLREEARRALIGDATALGGLGGGNVRRELQRQAIGLAARDFDNQIGRLERARTAGQNAATGRAELLGNRGNNEASILQSLGIDLANLETGAGSARGAGRLSTAQLLSGQEFAAGLQEAGFNQQNRLRALDLIGQGGSDISRLIENAARNSGNLNLTEAELQSILTRLGVSTIPTLEMGRTDARATGNLNAANVAADTGTKIIAGII